jgi:hypothetical protein
MPHLRRSALTSFALRSLHIKETAQIRNGDAENVFNFLSFLDQEHTLDDIVEFRKQSPMKMLRNLSLSLRRRL